MFKTKDLDQLVDLMARYLERSPAYFFDDCMEVGSQLDRRQDDGFDDKDRAEQRGEPIPFIGDDDAPTFSSYSASVNTTTTSGATPPSADTTKSAGEAAAMVSSIYMPPLAWVLLWDGKYCNLYGEYVPDEFRRWGYVLWDERRWNNIEGARELLIELWASSLELQGAKECWAWLRSRFC